MSKEQENELIKKRISYYLQEKEITENRLAQLSGITQSTLNGIMNKGRIPRIDTIHSICVGLNISVKEFFDFQPYNTRNLKEATESELLTYLNEVSQELNQIQEKLKNKEG